MAASRESIPVFRHARFEGALARVREAGGEIEAPIETMPWGERMFYAKDPFGNPISFVDQETLFVGAAGGDPND